MGGQFRRERHDDIGDPLVADEGIDCSLEHRNAGERDQLLRERAPEPNPSAAGGNDCGYMHRN
jgi:hypothetical protein